MKSILLHAVEVIGALMVLLVFFASARRHWSRRFTRMKYVIACSDGANQHPPGYEMAEHRYQIPARLDCPVEVVFQDVVLYEPDEVRRHRSISGLALLDRLRHQSLYGPAVICPYTPDVAQFVLKNPEVYPEEWKTKRVWFLGRIYAVGHQHPIEGIEWSARYQRPVRCIQQIIDDFDGNDRIAVAIMNKRPPVPKAPRPPASKLAIA